MEGDRQQWRFYTGTDSAWIGTMFSHGDIVYSITGAVYDYTCELRTVLQSCLCPNLSMV